MAVRSGSMSDSGELAGSDGPFMRKLPIVAASETKPAPMGLRERKKARLRRNIMDTTVNLCRDRGYENTTLEEIVRLVEISQPTFYNYFASKDAVLREFARDLLRPLEDQPLDEGVADLSASDKIRRHYEGVSEWMALDRPVWRAIILANAFNGARAPEQREAAAASSRPLEQILIEGQESGEFTKEFSSDILCKNLEAIQGLACLQWGETEEATFSLKERLTEGLEFFLRAARA